MRAGSPLVIAGAVAILDQLTKAWVAASFPLGADHDVLPGLFRLVHTRNTGIAFGLLGSGGPAVQLGLLAVVLVVVALLLRQLRRSGGDGPVRTGLALVLGGAVGNLLDRLLRGEVVDFLNLYVRLGGREYNWPAFNLADSAISIGATLVIVVELFFAKRPRHAPGTD